MTDSPPLFNPLTAADYAKIRAALAEVDKLSAYLAALGGLGHQVEGHQTSAAAAQQYLTSVLETFPEGA